MAYAEIADVRARAGRIAPAWDQSTTPGEADIERFLDDTASEIDAVIGSFGFTVPITDDPPVGALRRVNALGALSAALVATFPAGSGAEAVTALREQVSAEYDAEMTALAEGKHAVIVFLEAGTSAPGATDFWSENPDYRRNLGYGDILALNPYLAPSFEKGDPF